MNIIKVSTASALLLLLSAPAIAQESTDITEEVIVTASQHDKTESEIAGSLNILSGEELEKEVASTLGETLQNQLGVHSSSFGTGVGLPVIRGQSGKRVEVLQNNMVVADVSDTSADHAVSTEAFLANRIEVLRGPATLRYGAGAIGGVVNVIDHRIHNTFTEGVDGGVHVSYDTNNEERVGVAKLDVGNNGWMFHVDGVTRSNENVEIPGLADHEADDPDETTDGYIGNSDADAESFSFGVSHIGENVSGGISFSQLKNNYGLPPGAHGHGHDEHGDEHGEEHAEEEHEEEGHDHEEHSEEEVVRLDVEQSVYQGKFVFSNLGEVIDHIDLDFSYSDYKHEEAHSEEEHEEEHEEHEEEHAEEEEHEHEEGTVFESETTELRVELAHSPIQNWLGTLGFQYSDRDFVAEGEEAFVPVSTTDRFGIYVIEETEIGAGTVELGLRYDSQSISSDGISDIDHSTFNSSLSYLLPISDNQRFSLILNRSERSPVSEELLSDGEHIATNTYEIGDADLSNEEGVGIEVTWAVEDSGSGLSARASLFHTDFSNYIYEMDTELRFSHDLEEDFGFTGLDACSTEDDLVAFETEEEFDESIECFLYVEEGATFTGFEGEVEIALNDANSIRVWGDYVRAELDDSGDVPRMPPMRVGASWQYQQDGWNGSLSLTNAFDQDRPGEGQEETEGYLRVDASLGWSEENYSIFLKGTNLTDEEIRNSTSFLREVAPEPGRALSLGATFRF